MTFVTDEQIERFSRSLSSLFKQLSSDVSQQPGLDLTPPQFFILKCLSENAVCKVTELAEQMQVKPSAITVMIDRLVGREYVERRQDANDRRVVLLALTKDGQTIVERVRAVRNELLARRLSKLEPDELERMLQALETISPQIGEKGREQA